ncbi:MAG: phosphoribosylaminoimidazolesuccinocarboxamide synthase [Dehalococcoidia bacterium]|nr:phosphoribosylaminoimidazolesuccinocarboxamide synthase [Dehalococcoidia bacterium]
MSIVLETELALPLFCRGKVRDIYDLGDELLIVSTDRISAFDLVLPCGIPGKGKVLNQISAFWFEKTRHFMPNHLIRAVDSAAVLEEMKAHWSYSGELPDYLIDRSMLVTKTERIPVECVVRGYLAGSAWEEYEKTGWVGKIVLPPGMRESQELPNPIFTPTTKNEVGHDQPLTEQDVSELGLRPLIGELEAKSLLIYNYARNYAQGKGIVIADTKLEFGLTKGELILVDELLTPDSSRFWDADQYRVGVCQHNFDKQSVRDWLVSSGWDKEPPSPALPQEVIEETARRYREVYDRLTV